MTGVLIVNKPKGITSHDVVNKIRKVFSTRQVGHTGTLDPLATGVLPILVGNAVKASEYLTSESKTYKAGMLLGKVTDTEDISGKVLCENEVSLSDEEVEEAVLSFLGDYMQTPPMYSAIKVGGEKLYDKARRGETIEREARKVRVFDISAKKMTDKEWEILVTVSKGTYIRTLITDIGKKLSVGATMSSLERVASGDFNIESSHTLDEILSSDNPEKFLIDTETLFINLPLVPLPEFYRKLASNGAEIYLSRAKLPPFKEGERVRIADENGIFFALGEVRAFEKGLAIKPIKFFTKE